MNNVKPQAENLPFVAPCRTLSANAPWRWLKLGFHDTRQAWPISLCLGLLMAILIMGVSIMAWNYGSAWIMFSLLCGFVFVAPLACIGTYAISAQLERGLSVSLMRTLRACLKRYIGTELVFTLVLLIIFLLWARASSVTSIFIPNGGDYTLADMSVYLGLLAIVSLIFLGITFAASVFALPMIMHRDVDAITAAITSINAVLRNKTVMMIWAVSIAFGLLLGMATAGIALIFFLPTVGHAVWHGYLETIDASEFPRHKNGITATARKLT